MEYTIVESNFKNLHQSSARSTKRYLDPCPNNDVILFC